MAAAKIPYVDDAVRYADFHCLRHTTSLLLYAYCVGIPSSRKIEKATYHQIPFRVIAADQHPDHDTIAEFRKRHLKALSGLFVQIKETRGFRRFLLRGLENVSAEWDLICLTHNLLKLFRSGRMPKVA